MNLSCHRVVNETTGKIAVYFFWEVGNNPRVLSAIDHYSVLVVIVEADQSDIPDIKDVLWSNSSLQARVCCNLVSINSCRAVESKKNLSDQVLKG